MPEIALARLTAAGALFLAAGVALHASTPWAIFWTAPLLLLASVLIAWAAESAQFFIAQGFALAILAWLQTLPEFAVEAVLAWHQQTELLISNLTGALRLLTGFGWPLIFATASVSKVLRHGSMLRHITLEPQDSVQIVGLLASLIWIFVIFFKDTLGLVDAGVLIAIYGGYLYLLNRVPPQPKEDAHQMERIPRAIVMARPAVRNMVIPGLFIFGGLLIWVVAEPFLASLLAVSFAVGISEFVAVQWIAPFVSEFPEKISAFYWARTIDRAPMALMNMVSSNINQWTLLAAMLPIVLSLGAGAPSEIRFDRLQELELLMTAGQSLLGALLLLDMKLAWWEAAGLFLLWLVQFVFSILPQGEAFLVHEGVTIAYFAWCLIEIIRLIVRWEIPPGFAAFRDLNRPISAA